MTRPTSTKPVKKAKRTAPMIQVGADKLTLVELGKQVMAIVESAAADSVKIAAIEALKQVLPSHVTISGCYLQG